MSPARKLHLASLAATLALFALMSALASFPIIDSSWRMSFEEVYALLDGLGAHQLQLYRIMLVVDFAAGAAYVALLVLTMRWLFLERLRARTAYLTLAAIPLAAGLFDWLENATILFVAGSLPERVAVAGLVGHLTSAKWAMLMSSGGIILVAGCWLGAKELARRASQRS
jgi:hypothetical protein